MPVEAMTDRKNRGNDSNPQRRAAQRASVSATARLREAGRTPFEVTLSDLSATGFRMETFARLQVGTKIWVNLPDLAPLEAFVRRCDGQIYGCEFLRPLHPAVTEHLQTRFH